MIEMTCNGDFRTFSGGLYVGEIYISSSIFDSSRRSLHDYGGLCILSGVENGENHLHIFDIERTYSVLVPLSVKK